MTLFGLGNPGDRYAETRHNAGFMVLDTLARRWRARFRSKPGRRVARADFAGRTVTLVEPLLYMNESGVPVREHLAEEPDDFFVVCDDLALPFGRLRIRPKGSDGGHNGLASIIYHLETDRFPRLRVGIGEPPEGVEGADYVLDRFLPEETERWPEVLKRAGEACACFVADGLEAAMNRYNPAEEAA
jgi:PTH1 family peptidyl-tRNA hydrolase